MNPLPHPHPRPHPLPHPISSRTHRCSSRTCSFSSPPSSLSSFSLLLLPLQTNTREKLGWTMEKLLDISL